MTDLALYLLVELEYLFSFYNFLKKVFNFINFISLMFAKFIDVLIVKFYLC